MAGDIGDPAADGSRGPRSGADHVPGSGRPEGAALRPGSPATSSSRQTHDLERPRIWRTPEALWDLVLFELAVLGWTAGTLISLNLFGAPLGSAAPAAANSSISDALWHLGTAVLLALGAWNRTTLWVAPLMALGLDVDHLPGVLGLAAMHRPAHDLVFVVVAVVLLYVVVGRAAALTAGGAVLAHIAVDGGSFPLFSPLTTTRFLLPFPAEVVLALSAALLFYVAVRSAGSLRSPRNAARVAGVTLVVAAVIYFFWPVVATFSQV